MGHAWHDRLERNGALVRAGAWAVALLCACWLLGWSVSPDHFFFADDWDWLHKAQTVKPGDQFTLLPRAAYNDRPVGALFIMLLYRRFGVSPAPYHWVLLGLHLLNMTLALALARRWLASWWTAAAAALAWGTWSTAIGAATWLAAVFDVLASTLVLASILSFLSRRAGAPLLSAVLYFLAVRTKEAAIGLPALLLLFVLIEHPRRAWLREACRALWPHLLIAVLLIAWYVPLLATHQGNPDRTYRLEITPGTFADSLYYYLSSMLYGRPWPVGRLIRSTVVAALVAAALAWRTRATLAAMAGFVVFLAPVIFLARHRDVLYLYLPAMFFALVLGLAAEAAANRARLPAAWRVRAATTLALLPVVALPQVAYMRRQADWRLENSAQARRQLEAVRPHRASLKPGARVALLGFPPGNVFRTGDCWALKVYYDAPEVTCALTGAADVVVKYADE